MGGVQKDASVGEYDPRTGLTRVTRQRGRLLFNMGASARKQRLDAPRGEPQGPRPASAGSVKGSISSQETAAEAFTGLSLYPEEALYLVQHGALAVFPAAADRARPPLDATALAALLVRTHGASLACLDVYAFLKREKLHPRRCPVTTSSHGGDSVGWGQRRAPRHVDASSSSGSCSIAFDVWKSVVAPSLPPDDAANAPPPRILPGTAGKRLQLVFRVLVGRFEDPPPAPSALSAALAASEAERPGVPVKLAVVGRDRSVLLLELSAP